MTRKGSHGAHLLCGRSASHQWAPPVTLMLMQLHTMSPRLTSPWAPSRVHLTNSPCLPEASFVSAQKGFSQKLIPLQYRWRKKKKKRKKSLWWHFKDCGWHYSQSTDRLGFRVQMLRKEQMHLPLQRNASSQVIEPLVAIEWRGVPAAWSAGLCAVRGVQRWAPVRIRWEMARVWSPIRCQRCCGC